MKDRDMFYVKAVELVALLALGMAVLGAMGCSAGKTVSSETVTAAVKRDSFAAVKADTVWRDRFVERIVERVKKEATSVRDSTATVVDADGRVVRTDHWRVEKTRESSEETERYKDSAAMWRARYEGLLRVKADSVGCVKTETAREEEKNTRPVWHWWNVAAFVMMGVVAVGAVVRDCWRRGHGG